MHVMVNCVLSKCTPDIFTITHIYSRVAWWPIGRASDSGARGRGFDSHKLPCCVLEQDT